MSRQFLPNPALIAYEDLARSARRDVYLPEAFIRHTTRKSNIFSAEKVWR